MTPDAINLSAAFSACEAGQQWRYALRLLGDVPQRLVTPDAISSTAISACEEGQQWRNALQQTGDTGRHQLCRRHRRLRGNPQRSVTPDAINLSAAFSACEAGQQWGHARRLLAEMPQLSVTPDVTSFPDTSEGAESTGTRRAEATGTLPLPPPGRYAIQRYARGTRV